MSQETKTPDAAPAPIVMGRYGLLEREDGSKDCKTRFFSCLLTPCLLVVHSIKIYLWPCIEAYLLRCCCAIMCLLCSCSCWKYKDSKFPADDSSLGNYEAKREGSSATWRRSIELSQSAKKQMRLFEDDVDPSDIAQGALGDCWLLSALATLSEKSGAIEKCFMQTSYNPRGKYTLRFFDELTNKFVKIKVDDRIPCDSDNQQPLFTSPHGDELWVMLIEKAFAKFVGSYASLEGGHSLWALRVMTGDEVLKWEREAVDNWGCYDLKSVADATNKRKVDFFHSDKPQLKDSDMFNALAAYCKDDCVLSASTNGEDKTRQEGHEGDVEELGIVPGHAYSVLDVMEVKSLTGKSVRLLNLRNPWGSFEWKGDWSDDSPLWKQNHTIKAKVDAAVALRKKSFHNKTDDNDGSFWMCWEDFLTYFHGVDVCIRTTGMADLALDTNEEMGACGPCVGCLWGCFKYWFCCCGCYKLWCGKKSDKKRVYVAGEEHV